MTYTLPEAEKQCSNVEFKTTRMSFLGSEIVSTSKIRNLYMVNENIEQPKMKRLESSDKRGSFKQRRMDKLIISSPETLKKYIFVITDSCIVKNKHIKSMNFQIAAHCELGFDQEHSITK